MDYVTISAYQFTPLDNLPQLRQEIKQKCLDWGFKGTVLLAPEGLNCFLYGTQEKIFEFKQYLETHLNLNNLCFKANPVGKSPFNRMLVKIKKEIITMGAPEIKPESFTAPYLAPAELKKWLDEGKDLILLDTRNDYEVSEGTFEKAIHFDIKSFKEFKRVPELLPEDVKDKTIVTFCTGGIRCEKASAFLMNSGFQDVYQLQGGILKYFEDCDSAHYKGNCFVFDWRLAVDSSLKPQPRISEEDGSSGRHRLTASSEMESCG